MTRFLVASALLMACAVSLPAIFWHGGSLELETISFVTNYSAERPFLEKIFDPRVNDFDNYQARELSYVIDYADAMFYRRLVSASDRAFFIPVSALVSSLLLVAVFMSGVRRITRHVDPLTAGLLLACLLTSFQFVFTMGMLYRSSKPVLAVALLALLFRIVQVLGTRQVDPGVANATRIRDGLSTFALALLCGLMDRQGFYYVCIACLFLIAHYVTTRTGGSLIAGSCSALILLVLYNLVLAPALILHLNGYRPSFSMQNIALGRESLVARPWTLVQAFQLLAENTGVVLGGFRPIGFIAVGAFLALTATAFRKGGSIGWRYAPLALGAQLLMFALMIQKLPQFYEWIDHRYWYYPLPFLVTFLFAAALGLDRLLPRIPSQLRWTVPTALLVIAAGNLLSLGGYRTLVAGGPWFGEIYPQSERLKASLQIGAPDPALNKDYRQFYDFTMSLREGHR